MGKQWILPSKVTQLSFTAFNPFSKRRGSWINLNSYHLCLRNPLGMVAGWGASGHWAGCASSPCWAKLLNTSKDPQRGWWCVPWSYRHGCRPSRGHILVATAPSRAAHCRSPKLPAFTRFKGLAPSPHSGLGSETTPSERPFMAALFKEVLPLLLVTALCSFLMWFFLQFICTHLLICCLPLKLECRPHEGRKHDYLIQPSTSHGLGIL